MKRLIKNFVFDIILAVLSLALAIVMLPPFGISAKVLNVLLAIALVFYLLLYLLDKVVHARGNLLILLIVEFSVISLIAIGLLFQQFGIFNISGVCRILGVVLWLRGAVSLIRAYFVVGTGAKKKYSLLIHMGYILLLSFGAYIFASPFISDLALCWIFSVAFFVTALVFTVLAVLSSPAKKK